MRWTRNHLFGLSDLTREEIETILQTSKTFKEVSERRIKKVPALRGKTVVNLFFEPSTRTRTSFELAAKRLSADVLNFSPAISSLSKGETILDTLKNLEAYSVDVFVVRHTNSGSAVYLSEHTNASVINAGDGENEHPTQALLDMFTVQERLGTLSGLKVAIVGDIYHSRVARSNIWGFSKCGSEVWVSAPPTLIPKYFETLPVKVTYHMEEALKGADVVIMLRIQNERFKSHFFPSVREYREFFSLSQEKAKLLKEKTLVMHPGPVNWDIDIASALKERVFPLILEQVTNGLAVRMAVIYLVKEKQHFAVTQPKQL